MLGINVRVDNDIDYAALIVNGLKHYESRNSDSLKAYVGKRVGIVRTGKGKAACIGSAVIGAPIVVNDKQFRMLEHKHLVPENSAYDIAAGGGVKYLYPIIKPQKFSVHLPVKHGIVSRKVILPERKQTND